MKIDVQTICSCDYFQHYIPMYVYCMHRAYPDFRICVGLNGELDDITRRALEYCPDVQVRKLGDEGYTRTDGIIITENAVACIFSVNQYPKTNRMV